MCAQEGPVAPNDPSKLRTESQRRRNQPPKPLRKRRRRREVDDPLDWDKLPSVPLVRADASPESGEDYWVALDETAKVVEEGSGKGKSEKEGIDEGLKQRLKEEVVSPYTQNWILRAVAVVLVLVVLVAIFGGEEKVPIIRVPDL